MSINYIPRVTQLDAVQLDDEVIELFKTQLLEATKFFEPGILTPILPELDFIVRTLVFKYSLYNNGYTFGQQMLSLKYNNKYLSKGKLHWYYFYTVLLQYFKERATYSYTTNAKVQSIVEALERFQLIGDVLNFMRFIQNGKCPRLIDYLLNMEMTAEKITREDLSDFSWTRELLWNNFIELFGSLLSLTSAFNLRGRLVRLLRWTRRRRPVRSDVRPTLTINSACPCCRAKPVLPHTMGCSHVFCYYCLKANKIADKDFSCPECDFNGNEVVKLKMP